jgi:peptidoglycan/xylan/chitin deacetylase (PgdA/CDA1 family)
MSVPAKRAAWPLGALVLAIALASAPARAVDCPGNPNALGTSRTLVVDPTEHPRIGTMQYPETLPLKDHEVVLTFDDGPLPPHTRQVLQILASQCVKATFFIIGRMAQQYPAVAREVYAAGHSIGTHSQNHPLHFNTMPVEQVRKEIDDGIASTAAALGDPAKLAPFFRVPGLRRGHDVEDYLVSKGIQSWSADFPADDWRHISADQVYHLAISRIEAKGRGILLLHDIQARTVAALPRILQTLKERGYHIVHVVPAAPGLPKTPTQPWEWLMRPASETVAIARWPAVPRLPVLAAATLPAPALSESDLHDGRLLELPRRLPRGRKARLAMASPFAAALPPQPSQRPADTALMLPVPGQAVFELPDEHAAIRDGVGVLRRSARQAAGEPLPDRDASGLLATEAAASQRRIPGSAPIAKPVLNRIGVAR